MLRSFCLALTCLLCAPWASLADVVNLPYTTGLTDALGNQWLIFPQGTLHQQGNQAIFGQAGRLTVGGRGIAAQGNTAELDDKTGEVIFAGLQSGDLSITRRILIDKESRSVRYAEVITNHGGDTTATLTIQANLNAPASGAATIGDGDNKKKLPMAAMAIVHNQRAAIHLVAGRGGKVRPSVNLRGGSGVSPMTTNYRIPIARGETAVVVHVYATAARADRDQWIGQLRDSDVLRTLPPDLRSKVVNFGGTGMLAGDMEVLRGDAFDIVELRSGDQLLGTLGTRAWVLDTFYGAIELDPQRIVGLINVGEYRPRQLLVTRDGEIFGGKLQGETIPFELTSGQTLNIPLSQIARAGVRMIENEPDEWPADKAMAVMVAGDRIAVEPPAEPIELVTRYTALSLPADAIAAIEFVDDDNPVHRVHLRDGSRFAAVVTAPHTELKLTGSTRQQAVRFATSSLRRLQFAPIEEPDADEAATIQLVNDDLLVGEVSGALELDTTFDTIQLNGPEIAGLGRDEEGPDVQVTLWDGTRVKGRLRQEMLDIRLGGGVNVSVPVPLLKEYRQPAPRPPASMLQRIGQIVARLSAEDWQERDRAQEELTTLGRSILPALRLLRPDQPPEAQQRIDQVIAALEKAGR